MNIVKTLSFLIGIPVYIFSLLFLLISITGFGWEKGNASFETLLPVALLVLASFLFYKIKNTNDKKVLLLSVVFLFISIFSSLSILMAMSR
jgi:O-antigen ligase